MILNLVRKCRDAGVGAPPRLSRETPGERRHHDRERERDERHEDKSDVHLFLLCRGAPPPRPVAARLIGSRRWFAATARLVMASA